MTNELNPTPQKADEMADELKDSPGQSPIKRPITKPLPDWKPLGAVRDYFTELMKQDDFR